MRTELSKRELKLLLHCLIAGIETYTFIRGFDMKKSGIEVELEELQNKILKEFKT